MSPCPASGRPQRTIRPPPLATGDHGGDDLVEGERGGIDLHGVGGLAQRRHLALAVAPVPVEEGGEDLRHVDVLARRRAALQHAAPPGLRARGEEHLHAGVREHVGPDVAALHDDVRAAPERRWRSTSSRRTPGSADTTEAAAPISSVRIALLTSRSPAKRRPCPSKRSSAAAATREDGGLVVQPHAGLCGEQADGAIHGAGVEIEVAESLGDAPGDGALARADRAVDGDDGHSTSARVMAS